MVNSGIMFATITAIMMGLLTVFHKQAADKIHYLFGAIVISSTAVIIGVILIMPQIQTVTLYSNPKGLIFVVLAGVCALCVDFFAMKAYGAGVAISIVGPLIITGGIAVAAVLGFVLGEAVTFPKMMGIMLAVAGAGILAAYGV